MTLGGTSLARITDMDTPSEEREGKTVEGFYSLAISFSGGNTGGGVAVLSNGRIFGGDGSMAYHGTYQIQGLKLACSLVVESFNGFRRTVFDAFESGGEFYLTGSLDDGMLKLVGRHGGMDQKLEIVGTPVGRFS